MWVSDVTLIWETETDVQYTVHFTVMHVRQPLTADSGPFDLPPPATLRLKTAFVQNSQFANILHSQRETDSRRQNPAWGFARYFCCC